MSKMLAGKTVVVTGGSSGIGRGIALSAALHGAKVVIVGDLSEQPREGGASTTVIIEQEGVQALFVKTDVTSRDDVEKLLESAEAFGGVDLMVCNAGIALPGDGPNISEDDFAKLIAVNLNGVLISSQCAANQMIRLQKGGSIVATSSMGGLRGTSFTTGYSCTKGGVNLMVASLADALGPSGIRINAVCPGLIDTALMQSSPAVAAVAETFRQRMPLRRLGLPREVGDVVCWLGSDFSSFITGVALPVDGGQTAVI